MPKLNHVLNNVIHFQIFFRVFRWVETGGGNLAYTGIIVFRRSIIVFYKMIHVQL